MPRPKKCRKVCSMPGTSKFVANNLNKACISLKVDEYECVRLIDYKGFSQEKCAEYMQVSRATVQLIYDGARKKIATALVEGCSILIEGGNYKLCDGKEEFCGCGGCKKHQRS